MKTNSSDLWAVFCFFACVYCAYVHFHFFCVHIFALLIIILLHFASLLYFVILFRWTLTSAFLISFRELQIYIRKFRAVLTSFPYFLVWFIENLTAHFLYVRALPYSLARSCQDVGLRFPRLVNIYLHEWFLRVCECDCHSGVSLACVGKSIVIACVVILPEIF